MEKHINNPKGDLWISGKQWAGIGRCTWGIEVCRWSIGRWSQWVLGAESRNLSKTDETHIQPVGTKKHQENSMNNWTFNIFIHLLLGCIIETSAIFAQISSSPAAQNSRLHFTCFKFCPWTPKPHILDKCCYGLWWKLGDSQHRAIGHATLSCSSLPPPATRAPTRKQSSLSCHPLTGILYFIVDTIHTQDTNIA